MADLDVQRYQFEVPKNLHDFDPKPFVESALKWADGLVKPGEKVALSASGGVDSTTVAFLLEKVLGDRLHLYFIDDGFRRIIGGKPEWQVTAEMFEGFPNFDAIHTEDRVLPWFEGEANGTLKRDMFRQLYVLTSNMHLAHIGANWIADGTIGPDIVMTNQGRQTQHNVNLPYSMRKLEPLAPLYKPHVRKVAMYLGLPREFAMRIPCPGPAQLLRVGGKFDREKLRIAKGATDIVEQMVESFCMDIWNTPYAYNERTGVRSPFQYFGTCLDPEMEQDSILSAIARSFLGNDDVECYRMGTEAMWIDIGVDAQQRRLYAPIAWVSGPRLELDGMIAFSDDMKSKVKGVPRVLYEVFNSGRPGYPAGIKAVESEDVRCAEPMRMNFDYLEATGKRICDETGASMAGYDISFRPPATIELF